MNRKKKILLNWWYQRQDLLAPFLKLKDEFEFVLIFIKSPASNEPVLPFQVIFWDQFASPFQLLDSINPDEVLFINIDGPYQIALNLACRKRAIKTSICDHALAGYDKYSGKKVETALDKWYTARFLFGALSTSDFFIFPKLVAVLFYRLTGKTVGSTGSKLVELGLPNRFICYTRYSADFFRKKYQGKEFTVSITGNPSFDVFFTTNAEENPTNQKYYLLIDQPFVGNGDKIGWLTLDQKNRFLEKLALFCSNQGKMLKVKLHPDDYHRNDYLEHAAIEYHRQTDLVTLVAKACGVFGFYSTSLVPAILLKKCIVFRIKEMPIQELWHKLEMVQLLDFFTFNQQDLDFEKVKKNPEQGQAYTDLFLYKADGKALQRLSLALKS